MHCEFCFHRKLKTAKEKPNNRAMDEDLLLVEINGNDSGDSSSDRSYIPENGNSDSSSLNEEETDVEIIAYDTSLPGTHSYLGDDLEELRGRTLHDDDTYLSLPILSLPGVILLPGQTLPLNLLHDRTIAMMSHILGEDRTFGMVTSRLRSEETAVQLASIGTTAEVLAYKEDTDELTHITTMKVKAIGRQRFEIKKKRRQANGVVWAKVRILSERVLPDPLEGARPLTHSRVCAYNHRCELMQAPEGHAAGQQAASRPTRKVNRLTCANFTAWPPWVYKQYDVYHLMRAIRSELNSWNDSRSLVMPNDPVDLSYWVASNLPLDDTLKLHLLTIDSAIQRLRCELSIMRRCTMLSCKICGQLLANKGELFSMAVEGPMGAYVNTHGYVHEMLTVLHTRGLVLVGHASEQNSWFPGYAWTISECEHCGQHIGWKFTACKRSLRPQKFWGLSRSSLLPSLQNRDDETGTWRPIM